MQSSTEVKHAPKCNVFVFFQHPRIFVLFSVVDKVIGTGYVSYREHQASIKTLQANQGNFLFQGNFSEDISSPDRNVINFSWGKLDQFGIQFNFK